MKKAYFIVATTILVLLASMAVVLIGAEPLRSRSLFAPQAPAITATKTDGLAPGGDVDGDGQADPGDTLRYTIVIDNAGTGAEGVVFNDTLDVNTTYVAGSLKSTPLARNDNTYTAIGNVLLTVDAAGGLLTNDADLDGGSLTASASATSAQGGNVSVNPDGGFTYNPPPGFEGVDTFTYTVTDSDSNTDTATVTITVSGMIWFVNSAATCPCDGRYTNPFNALTGTGSFAALAADDLGDNIFLYSGAYTGGLTLQADQRLIGQGATDDLATITGLPISPAMVPTGGIRPSLSASGTNITATSGNQIIGLNLTSSGANGILAANISNLTLEEVAVSNSTGIGISLSNTSNVTLSNVRVNDHGDFAIRGTNVTDFTLADSTVDGINGDDHTLHEAAVAFDGLLGASAITNSTIRGGVEDNLRIVNTSGALTLSVTNSIFRDNHAATGGDGVLVLAEGSANASVNVTSSLFTANRGDHFQAVAQGSAQLTVIFTNNTLSGDHPSPLGQGITLSGGLSGSSETVLYNISNNTIADTESSSAINVNKGLGGGTWSGTIAGNTIGAVGVPASGCAQNCSGIQVVANGSGSHTAAVTNNIIRETGEHGIVALARDGSVALDVTISGNTISDPQGPFTLNGVLVQSGAAGTDTTAVCADIRTNSISGSWGSSHIRLRNRFVGTTFRLPGYGGGGTDTGAVANFLLNQNTAATASATVNSNSFGGGAACVSAAQPTGKLVAPATGSRPVAKPALHGRPSAAPSAKVNDSFPPTLTIGALPAGKSITLVFRVKINAGTTATQVCNHGTVTGSNFTAVQTNDPDTGAAGDATCTTVQQAPPTQTFYLHGTGPNNNPPTLFLNTTAPTATTAKYKDSPSVNFNGGNSWKEVGTWPAASNLSSGQLITADDLHVWLGLKNSDDQGTKFDVRAEVYKNSQLLAAGETYCITDITRNENQAKEVVVDFGSVPSNTFNGTSDVLSVKVLTRIGTNGAGGFCGGHSNAVGLRLYFDAVSRLSRFKVAFQP